MKRYRVPMEGRDWGNKTNIVNTLTKDQVSKVIAFDDGETLMNLLEEDSEFLCVFVIEANSPEEAIEKAKHYVDDVWDKEGEHKWDYDIDVFEVEEIDKSEWDFDENEVHSVSHPRS